MSDKHYTHPDQTYLESALRSLRPWLEANATFLIYGLAAILAAVAGIIWYQRQPEENAALSALWMDAREPEDYQNIADTWEGTRLGTLARLSQADSLLNKASRSRFTDRQAALTDQELAEAALNRLVERTDLDGSSRQRVLMDQARLAELNCDGSDESVQKAVAAWQAVLDEFEAPWAKDYIESRIERLQKPETSRFYTWFSQLDPKPLDNLDLPQDGQNVPSGETPPSDGPASAVPAVPELPEMGDGSAEPAGPSSEPSESETSEDTEGRSPEPDASGDASGDTPALDSTEPSENDGGAPEEDAPEESEGGESSSENAESSSGTGDSPVEGSAETPSSASADGPDADSDSADKSEDTNDSSTDGPDGDTEE